ncbi:transglycosylase domain-containing protein [Garciella nitratireducens]|uniref:transglycosylase domain-containing protein n=1 Tax=Garciella nitratireducens TaxID=218205 RepID=UPI000DE91B1B|nr:transglycosylase domain-containing protein [Garciella nitratireducens]RBP40243.1 penicillin-binding protein 1A [Garciella nitratireducens]
MRKRKNLIVLLFIFIITMGTISGSIFFYIQKSPPLDLKKFHYIEPCIILDDQGNFYEELQGKEKREVISIDQIPNHVLNAFISIEDERFYRHPGIDIRGILRAAFQGIKAGDMTTAGGSTITQQLIKLTHLSSEKKISRKIQEAYLAIQLEYVMNKDEILENYLNKINFAYAHGIQAASQTYFRKNADQLSISQAAVLAAIPKAPTAYKPYIIEKTQEDNFKIVTNKKGKVLYSEKNQERALLILKKMKELKFINEKEYAKAKNELLNNTFGLKQPKKSDTYSYFTDAVYDQVVEDLIKKYFSDLPKDEAKEKATNYMLNAGLTVYSTVDTTIQTSMEENFKNNTLFPSQSSVAKKASLEKSKELGVEVNYEPEGAMVIIENSTGKVKGLIGGRKKTTNLSLNRAFRKIQPGSVTKPLTVYAPGIDSKKISLNTTYYDGPLKIGDWKVKNSGSHYSGRTTVREGLRKSKNSIAVQAWYDTGLETSIKYGKKFGLSFAPNDMAPAPLALGGYTYGQTPMAMASAYTTFPNQGIRNTPILYTKVVDANGKIILEKKQQKIKVISPESAYLITDVLKDVVNGGTTHISIPNMPVAGKTGTTNNLADAWFIGYTPYYTGAVWYGYDHNKILANNKTFSLNINVYGGSKPGPALMWEKVMTDIHKNLEPKDFPKVSISPSQKIKPKKSSVPIEIQKSTKPKRNKENINTELNKKEEVQRKKEIDMKKERKIEESNPDNTTENQTINSDPKVPESQPIPKEDSPEKPPKEKTQQKENEKEHETKTKTEKIPKEPNTESTPENSNTTKDVTTNTPLP